MPFDPFSSLRPQRARCTVVVDEDSSLSIELEAMDLLSSFQMDDLQEQLSYRYLGANSMPFPPVGGEAIPISESLLLASSALAVMCRFGVDGDLQARAHWFTALAAAKPEAFRATLTAASSLNGSPSKVNPGFLQFKNRVVARSSIHPQVLSRIERSLWALAKKFAPDEAPADPLDWAWIDDYGKEGSES